MSFLFRYLRFHDIIGGIHVPVDDGVDKLNRKYTLLVFLFLALPIFTKQYIGEPIECFAPVYFAEHQSRYINSYCWTQSTYYMVPVGDPEDDGDQQEPPDRIMPDEVDYFIGFETVTHIGNERLRRVRVNYYQWAPLILLAQGLCFYIPFLIWNSCANNAGVKLRRLLKKASDIASLPPGCQQREALLAEFVDQFHTLVTGEAGWCADLQCGMGGAGGESNSSSLISGSSSGSGPQPPVQTSQPSRGGGGGRGHANNHQANHSTSNQDDTTTRGDHRGRHHGGNSGCCLGSIPIIGNLLACCLKPCASFGLVGPSKYLSLLYLAVKTAYVLNVGLQFFLLGQFLGRGYLKHGIELLNRLIINGEWWASPRFPLSTLCQVRADMSGGLRSYTCQCVLPINVFNEKIFSVVWFYMAFLLPLNVLSLLFWIYRTFEANRLSYIRLCLWRTRLVELNQIHRTVRRLSQSYLGWDGVFLLRLIEHNHGSIMATLIMSRLWEFYANQMKLQEDANQLALANNAQYTLAQTTTAISNQHQMMMAAAAAAAQQPNPQQQVGGGGGGHGPGGHAHPNGHPNQGGHGHGFVGGQGGGHGHGGQQPLMPTGNGHGGGGHSHGPIHPAAAMVHGQPLAPMVPHGPHGHHAGQINQPGGHHPLHAANTHAHNHKQPLHLNAFANATNASLLAQLQQQHHHHQQQQQQQQQHQHQTSGQNPNQQNQQSAPGNVAAAVAALAAAAAANHSSNANAAKVAALGTAVSNAQAAAAAVAAQANSSNKPNLLSKGPQLVPVLQQTLGKTGGSGANNNNNSNNNSNQISSSSNANTNTNNNSTTKASSATTSFITNPTGGQVVAPGGPPLPPPPPAHVVAAVAAAAGVPGVQQNLLGSASGPGSASVRPNGQQQQQVSSGSGGRPMQQQQQPTNANSNNNPALNLRSSNIQAAAVAAASDGQGKFSPHTIKRT